MDVLGGERLRRLRPIGLSGKVMSSVTGFGLSLAGTIIVIVQFYLVLGMFMESRSMLVATVPIITPVGFNLFVVQGVRSRGQIYDVIVGSAPLRSWARDSV